MDYIIINEKDNVGVRLVGDDNIPTGHKFALSDINKGEYIIKYGEIIGRATADIKKGEWVLGGLNAVSCEEGNLINPRIAAS